jgi:PTS system galactitol-specific IIB component
MKNKIVVATGTSQHKLEFAVDYIKQYCNKNGYEAEVLGVNVYQADFQALDPSVIVLIGPNKVTIDRPVVVGTAFITKMGMDEACAKIASFLKK